MRSHQLLPLSVRLASLFSASSGDEMETRLGAVGAGAGGSGRGARTDVSLCQRISSLHNGAGDWQLTEQGQVAGVLGLRARRKVQPGFSHQGLE